MLGGQRGLGGGGYDVQERFNVQPDRPVYGYGPQGIGDQDCPAGAVDAVVGNKRQACCHEANRGKDPGLEERSVTSGGQEQRSSEPQVRDGHGRHHQVQQRAMSGEVRAKSDAQYCLAQ